MLDKGPEILFNESEVFVASFLKLIDSVLNSLLLFFNTKQILASFEILIVWCCQLLSIISMAKSLFYIRSFCKLSQVTDKQVDKTWPITVSPNSAHSKLFMILVCQCNLLLE
jgi:hypothetical protein